MSSLNPIELLEKELDENRKALNKSFKLFEKGEIDSSTHLKHKERLGKLISAYEYSLYLLKRNIQK
jgi:hypothetical protein